MRHPLISSFVLALALTACTSPEDNGIHRSVKAAFSPSGRAALPVVGVIMSTPPYNTLLFGPCKDEFALPDSRRGTCDLYYKIRGRPAPWAETETNAVVREYPSADLFCQRTLGGSPECYALRGDIRPPQLNGPLMGSD